MEGKEANMLKRCQVLLSDWQVEYIKNFTERYDFSFSEGIRILLSEGLLYMISLLNPEYKSRIIGKELARMAKMAARNNTPLSVKHKIISEVYFEARKATEYRLNRLKSKS